MFEMDESTGSNAGKKAYFGRIEVIFTTKIQTKSFEIGETRNTSDTPIFSYQNFFEKIKNRKFRDASPLHLSEFFWKTENFVTPLVSRNLTDYPD